MGEMTLEARMEAITLLFEARSLANTNRSRGRRFMQLQQARNHNQYAHHIRRHFHAADILTRLCDAYEATIPAVGRSEGTKDAGRGQGQRD